MKILKTKKEINKLIIVHVAIMLLIVISQCRNISEMYTPWLYNDEMGYWGNAAYFVGLDWSESVRYTSYYSFGYSFCLIPLFLVFKSSIMMYRGAIILNGIFLAITYLVAYKISSMLFKNNKVSIKIAVTLIAVLTPSALVQSQIAWSETLLLLVCWLIFWTFVKIQTDENFCGLGILAILNVYLYMVHQRMIGVLFVTAIYVLVMGVRRKKSLKRVLLFFAIMFIGLWIAFELKNYLQVNLWKIHEIGSTLNTSNINDYSGVSKRLLKYLTSEGKLKELLYGSIGKIIYFGLSTYGMLYYIAYQIFKEFRKRILKLDFTITPLQECWNYAFLLLAVTILVTILFKWEAVRNDSFIYGRYADVLVGPVILLGLMNIFNMKIKIRKLCEFMGLMVLIEGVGGWIVKHKLWQENLLFWGVMSTAMSQFVNENELKLGKMLFYILIMGGIFAICLLNTKKQILYIIILCIAIVGGNYYQAGCIYSAYIEQNQTAKIDVVECAQFIKNTEIKNIYYGLENTLEDYNANSMQFLLKNYMIKRILIENGKIPTLDESILILNKNVKNEYVFTESNDIVFENESLIILQN